MKVFGICAYCGDRATDRHHRDRNHENNEKGNVILLCDICHGKEHGPEGALARLEEKPNDLFNFFNKNYEGQRISMGMKILHWNESLS